MGTLLSPNMQCEVHGYLLFGDPVAALRHFEERSFAERRGNPPLLFIVSVGYLNMFINQRLFLHGLGMPVALVFPSGDIHETLVVA